jgi:hypothetical protein
MAELCLGVLLGAVILAVILSPSQASKELARAIREDDDLELASSAAERKMCESHGRRQQRKAKFLRGPRYKMGPRSPLRGSLR